MKVMLIKPLPIGEYPNQNKEFNKANPIGTVLNIKHWVLDYSNFFTSGFEITKDEMDCFKVLPDESDAN